MHLSNPCCEATDHAGVQQGKTQIHYRGLVGHDDVAPVVRLLKARQTTLLDIRGWPREELDQFHFSRSGPIVHAVGDAIEFCRGLVSATGGDFKKPMIDLFLLSQSRIAMAEGLDAKFENSQISHQLEVRVLDSIFPMPEVRQLYNIVIAGHFQLICLDCRRACFEQERKMISFLRGVLDANGGGMHHMQLRTYLLWSSQFEVVTEEQLAEVAV